MPFSGAANAMVRMLEARLLDLFLSGSCISDDFLLCFLECASGSNNNEVRGRRGISSLISGNCGDFLSFPDDGV